MADWTVTMTRTVIVAGAPKAIQADYVVENTTRALAIPLGIDELFTREAAQGYKLVPKEAVDYWHEKRNSGGILYEVQSELENNWGLTFGIGEAGEEPPPQNHARVNGHQPQAEISDLDTMLTKHMQALQARNEVLGEELKRKQAEYDRNNSDIMRIAAMAPKPPVAGPLMLTEEEVRELQKPGAIVIKKRGRPPKANAHVE